MTERSEFMGGEHKMDHWLKLYKIRQPFKICYDLDKDYFQY